jgi:hypothetical protein
MAGPAALLEDLFSGIGEFVGDGGWQAQYSQH